MVLIMLIIWLFLMHQAHLFFYCKLFNNIPWKSIILQDKMPYEIWKCPAKINFSLDILSFEIKKGMERYIKLYIEVDIPSLWRSIYWAKRSRESTESPYKIKLFLWYEITKREGDQCAHILARWITWDSFIMRISSKCTSLLLFISGNICCYSLCFMAWNDHSITFYVPVHD